jgi:thiol-disulfide isomerase/thioredoxin
VTRGVAALLMLGVLTAPARGETTGTDLAQAAAGGLVGQPAPALRVHTIDGATIDLARLYGRKALYLKFWATWCVPCRQQMPHLERTYEQAGDDLEVVAIDAGFNDSLDDVRAYRRSLGLRMPIVLDDGHLGAAFHLRVTPQHIVIGRDGRIAYVGHLADARLDAALAEARRRPAAAGILAAHAAHAAPAAHAYAVGDVIAPLALAPEGDRARPVPDPAAPHFTVLVFLSPWCESYLAQSRPARASACRDARLEVERLASRTDATWIGVASGLWATDDDVRRYRAESKVGIPVALDADGDLFRRFGIRDVPALVVVDPTGRVAARGTGAHASLAGTLAAAGVAVR